MPISESKEADGELVQRAKEGLLPAFDELVLRYRKNVYAIAFGMTRNHSDADDLAQETFLRAYEALDSFKPGYEFRTWLFRIAVNLSINCLKRKGRLLETSLEERVGLETAAPATPHNPGSEMEQKELGGKIEEAVEQLSPKLRSVFLLRTLQDLSYEEISKVLKISPGTVMSRLNRARQKLRNLLREYVEDR
ncbi:MAG: RNA polymerase sigma factor [bacterium]